MSTAKHIATFPLYGTHPLSGRVMLSNRIGTGYIYRPEQIAEEEARFAKHGHPVRLRWRNDECHADYCEWLETQPV